MEQLSIIARARIRSRGSIEERRFIIVAAQQIVNDGKPVHVDLQGRRPGAGGIIWNKDAGQWIAIRRYGHGVVLGWLAGPRRRLDMRWRRLDAVLTSISAE